MVTSVQNELEQRLGVSLNFLRVTSGVPEITESLCEFTRFAYLDNPLPSLFKERLFVYLSRFCEVRYCIARHVGFLVGLGYPAGDPQCSAQTIEEIMPLLRRPLPRGEALARSLALCAGRARPIPELPGPDDPEEEAIFACATHVFLQTPNAGESLEALGRILGPWRLEYLNVFIALVRTTLYWTKVHPELAFEDDVRQLLAAHEPLASCLLHDPEAHTSGFSQQIADAEAALHESAQRVERQVRIFDTTLSSIVDFAYIFDRDGRFIYSNQPLLDLLGITCNEIVGKNFFDLKYPDELASKLQRQIQQVIDTKSRITDETPFTSPTGVAGYYEYIFTPVIAANGSVEVVAGSTRNITKRNLIEKALQASEEALRCARDQLELRAAERTEELRRAHASLLSEFAERTRSETARLELLQQLVNAQEEERGRISREMHDSLGQHLTALTLGLTAVQAHSDCPAHMHVQLGKLRVTALQLDEEIDRLSHELRPPALDDLGLDAALHRHGQAWSLESGIAVEMHTLGIEEKRIPATIETTVYRIAQEAFTNIRKHANATRVSLITERRGGELRVIIEDDGSGFDAEKTLANAATRKLGLKGMYERAALVGGQIEIESAPGKGATIYVSIPLEAVSRESGVSP